MNDLLGGFVGERIEQALLAMHTAFLGRVVCLRGTRTDVQPLALCREASGRVSALPLAASVPKLRGLTLAKGDICLCVVCEREPGAALHGQLSLPAPGHHALSGCIIVGVVEA